MTKICYFMFRINKGWQHMIKIIFRTSQVSINMAGTLFSIYHNIITYKRQSDNSGFLRWICNWENTLSCVTTNTKSLNNKPNTHKHIIHRKQNILVKCKLGSGREISANDNTRWKQNPTTHFDRDRLILWRHLKILFVSCNLSHRQNVHGLSGSNSRCVSW